ncbi:DUF4870 domain-containing protein [Curtobacterium oceanosedimentum]|uniref:DUF4870 domain-containing protein n=1 Tax=Curtobacterium oceanosedimentum TaxID=465820 RepID=UPI001CE123F7|nr:DUF4870 domain-containing protein [Curtobacterium oceanosedimentum]MCA5923634.1 DUF4870 domain-containing protein [Curtobacterium oceanosedimentum]
MTYGQQPGGPQNPNGPQYPGGYTPPQQMRPEDQRLWATLTHIGGIFFNFVAPLVAYLVLRDRGNFIREHTRVALNFHITMGIAYVVSGLLTVVLIGALLIPLIAVLTLVFGIMAAIAANQGQFYRYPLSIEFIKQ